MTCKTSHLFKLWNWNDLFLYFKLVSSEDNVFVRVGYDRVLRCLGFKVKKC